MAIRKTRLGKIPAVNEKIVQLYHQDTEKERNSLQPVIKIDLSISSGKILKFRFPKYIPHPPTALIGENQL